jgi:hypothetical protein
LRLYGSNQVLLSQQERNACVRSNFRCVVTIPRRRTSIDKSTAVYLPKNRRHYNQHIRWFVISTPLLKKVCEPPSIHIHPPGHPQRISTSSPSSTPSCLDAVYPIPPRPFPSSPPRSPSQCTHTPGLLGPETPDPRPAPLCRAVEVTLPK